MQEPFEAPPPPAVDESLRTDYRMGAISQFVNTFKSHIGLEFDILELEQHLSDPLAPASAASISTLMGKLLNTVANDRNVNPSNWLSALRRQYTKRFVDYNPFLTYERVELPVVVDPPATAEEAKVLVQEDVKPVEAADGGAVPPVEGEPMIEVVVVEEVIIVEEILERKAEDGTGGDDIVMEDLQAAVIPAVIEEVLEEMGEKLGQVLDEVERLVSEEEEEAAADAEPTFYWEPKDIDWTEVDLDVKIDAIYQVCEWHMIDTERFRRLLKNDDELAWRLDPIGTDSKLNKYYHLRDGRLWIQRAPPPGPPRPKAKKVVPSIKITLESAAASKPKPKPKAKAASPPPPPIPAPVAHAGPSRAHPRAAHNPLKRSLSASSLASSSSSNNRRTSSRPRRSVVYTLPPIDAHDVLETGRRSSPRKRSKLGLMDSEEEEEEAGWERIPEELKQEWGNKAGKEEEKDGEFEDDDEEGEDEEDGDEGDEEQGRRRDSSLLSDISSREDEREEEDEAVEAEAAAEEEEEEEEKMEVDEKVEDESLEEPVDEKVEDDRMQWEKDYWAERARCEKPGFVEWEAICATPQEWEAFPLRFEKTKDRRERALRDLISIKIIPAVIEAYEAAEREREAQIAIMNRKRSSRIAIKESTADEDARIAAERAENNSRLSRASRHKILPSLANGGEGLGASGSGAEAPAAPHETREERLRKREEEKIARELEAERLAIEEAKRIAREEAIAANGGVVPPGWETPEELAAMKKQQEKEEKRRAKEAKDAARLSATASKDAERKKAKAARAVARRKERANEAKATAAAPEVEEEDPWYLDCEICLKQGWNQDDGSEIVGCDVCSDWQHVNCHLSADAAAGRPVVSYTTIDFVCSRCKADPTRKPRTRPSTSSTRGPTSAKKNGSTSGVNGTPELKVKRTYKPRAPKIGPDGQPLPKKEKKTRDSLPSGSIAGPSSSHTPQKASTAQLPPPGAPPLSYPDLLALITQNPILINGLPPAYQEHFSTLLSIPVPYPSPAQAPKPIAIPQPVKMNGASSTEIATATATATSSAPLPEPEAAQEEAKQTSLVAPTPAVVAKIVEQPHGDVEREVNGKGDSVVQAVLAREPEIPGAGGVAKEVETIPEKAREKEEEKVVVGPAVAAEVAAVEPVVGALA